MNLHHAYVLARTVHHEMMSRGPWDTESVELRVKGFYKFNPPGVRLDQLAYLRTRDFDAGLPEWEEFLALLEGSDLRQAVFS